MPFTLLQVGGSLKSINPTGGISSALTLPTGVQLATNRVPRFARFKRYIVVVNTPTRPLSVDTSGVVRVLTPAAPTQAVSLSAGAAGTLSGTYLSVITYKLLDSLGNVISESDFSPLMNAAVTINNAKLHANFVASSDTVDATQVYRTVTGPGPVYFPWTRVDGNGVTSVENDLSDASLGIIGAPELGSAPDLTLIAEWSGRLWGVDRIDIDNLRYTQAGTMYGWSALNTLPIPHIGSDQAGVTALIPRRAALGVARLNVFQQVTGSQRSNFNPVVVNGGEQVGCVSQESVVVFNDIAYFLWRDGVYKWDSNGITSITNGVVRTWFTTDTYFNRAMFWRSFAQIDPIGLKYRLFLASPGSVVNDRWIEYDLQTGAWWGPHKTDAFSPTCAILVAGSNQQPYYMIGSMEGYLSQDQEDKNDWGTSSINMSVLTKRQYADEPDEEKMFGELSVTGKIQSTGTMTITPSLGDVDNMVDQTAFAFDLSKGRQRLGRIGVGKYMALRFDQNTINQDVVLYGFELPVNIVGRR